MASFNDHFDLQLKTCPYNKAHRVKSTRYQAHITKCAKTSATNVSQLRVCPYNTDHRISDQEYSTHVITCADSLHAIKLILDKNCLNTQKVESHVTVHDQKWFTEDGWKQQYLQEGQTDGQNINTVANELLKKDVLTADELFQLNYGSDSTKKSFTDSLYLSRMSNEERKKYNNLLVEQAKRDQVIAANQTQTTQKNKNITQTDPNANQPEIEPNRKIQKVVDTNNNGSDSFRVPSSIPFARMNNRLASGVDGNCVTSDIEQLSRRLGIGRGAVFESHRK